MDVAIRILGPADQAVLARVLPGVFDNSVDQDLASEFLQDPRHHLAVALDGDEVVGFASGVHYVHPDKPPELWINEVAVAAPYQSRGIGKRLLGALFDIARSLGCAEAWVLTDPLNDRALSLYTAVGGHSSEQVMFSFQLGK
jgi:ribosomal protein S18 acetylase RimI-like enzyme